MTNEPILLPEGLTAVDSLLRADWSQDAPVVFIPLQDSETTLEIPAGAELTLVELPGANVNTRFDVSVEQGARFRHIRILTCGGNIDYHATQDDGSLLELSTIVLGGDSENTFALDCHEGTHTTLYGLAIPQGDEQVANHIRLYHKKPHGESYQTFKYVADGQSRARFDGKIIVEKDAQKIQAYQKNNNILLCSTARIETDPQLEIYADDVRCSHGATVGRLDETALFYMRSRGIPYPTARRMLIRSFLDDALKGIRIDWLNAQIEKIISHRLG